MVERYGSLSFFGDIQTPAVKARNSTEYPIGAWDLGVTGSGMNIAMVDTGVDNEHPGLIGKFVAGYDAVCFVHSDPQCILAGADRTTVHSIQTMETSTVLHAWVWPVLAVSMPTARRQISMVPHQTLWLMSDYRRRCRTIRELCVRTGIL